MHIPSLLNQIKTSLNSEMFNTTVDSVVGKGNNLYSFMPDADKINQQSGMWMMANIFDIHISAMCIPFLFLIRYFAESLSLAIFKNVKQSLTPEHSHQINKARKNALQTIAFTSIRQKQQAASHTPSTSELTDDTINKMRMLDLAQRTNAILKKYELIYPTQPNESQAEVLRRRDNSVTRFLTAITVLPIRIWNMLSISTYIMPHKSSLTQPVLSDFDRTTPPSGETLLCGYVIANVITTGRIISANNTTLGMISDTIVGYLALNTFIGVMAVALSSTLAVLTIPFHCINALVSTTYQQNNFISKHLSDIDAQSELMENHNRQLLQDIVKQVEEENADTPDSTIHQAQADNETINDTPSYTTAIA